MILKFKKNENHKNRINCFSYQICLLNVNTNDFKNITMQIYRDFSLIVNREDKKIYYVY